MNIRAAFEKWHERTYNLCIIRNSHPLYSEWYTDDYINARWAAWQACYEECK